MRLTGVVSSAQRRAERLHASWAFSNAGVSLPMTRIDLASPRGSFADDDGSGGDERLHPGDPDQIGRIRLAGEGPISLNLPGGQCGFQADGRPSPTDSWFIGCVDPPGR